MCSDGNDLTPRSCSGVRSAGELSAWQPLIPGLKADDAEVLLESGAVQPVGETVGLGTLLLGGSVLRCLPVEEELVETPIRPAAEFAAFVREEGLDGGPVLL